MEKTKSKAKKIAIIIAIVLASLILLAGILLLVESFYVRITPASKYTLEEHIERLSKRVDKRYIKSGRYEEYALYPVYNQNEELTHFIVEFDSSEFTIVKLADVTHDALGFLPDSMYQEFDSYLRIGWRRYRVNESDTIAPEPFEGHSWQRDATRENSNPYIDEPIRYYRYYETDGNGNFIDYKQSPFRIAGVGNSKLYFFDVGGKVSIPAIRDGDYFLNLISMERFHKDDYKGVEDYQSERGFLPIPYLEMGFSPEFALGV